MAARAQEHRFPAGTLVLLEDGPPAEVVFIVREGAVELVHQGEAVDILGPGESFGEPSFFSRLAPAFTVRARDDTVCLALPRDQAVTVFSAPAGLAHLARVYRNRLVQTGQVVHALPELGTIAVGDLVTRPPIFCEGSVTIRRAAQLMTDERSSAVLVRDGDVSILTDAVLRERVVAEGLSPDNPVSRIMRPAVKVGADRLAVDAVVEMLDAGTDHVVVTRAQGEVVGVLSGADLAGLEARSPFALRHAILSAHDEAELIEAAARMRSVFLTLLDTGIGPLDVCRVLSLQVDSLTSRLIELAIARHGPAPAAWAWLVLGSTARREFTLGSDVENALAYDDAGGDPELDAYFAAVAADVTRGLVACGFPLDANGVLASESLWRMSGARWEQTVHDCLGSPDRSHLIRANVAFDFRQVAGALDVTPSLVSILREAPAHPDLLRRLARSATDFKPPLGFRGSLKETGDARGIDVKQGGTIPIANLARFHALSNGITISATFDRLTAVEEAGKLDGETATALREAFAIVMRIRLERHSEQVEAGEPVDNTVDPAKLPPLARSQLREAFRAIAHAQKKLSVYVPMGM